MRKYIIMFVLLIYSTQIFAKETVTLFSPLVSISNGAKAENITFSKYYLAQYPQPRNSEQLLHEFENAQKYYLVKSNSLARQYYEKVISLAEIDDWSSVERQIIFLSY